MKRMGRARYARIHGRLIPRISRKFPSRFVLSDSDVDAKVILYTPPTPSILKKPVVSSAIEATYINIPSTSESPHRRNCTPRIPQISQSLPSHGVVNPTKKKQPIHAQNAKPTLSLINRQIARFRPRFGMTIMVDIPIGAHKQRRARHVRQPRPFDLSILSLFVIIVSRRRRRFS